MPFHIRDSVRKRDEATQDFPRQGLVNDACKGFAVNEDQALAHRLQNEEYQKHFGKNRSRNALLRQDTPHAKLEQLKEDEEAAKTQTLYELQLAKQEHDDLAYAACLARKLDEDAREERIIQEENDKLVAKKLMEEEKMKIRRLKEIKQVEREAAYLGINSGLNNVSLLSKPESSLSDLSDFCIQPSGDMDEDDVRKLQEGQDEELAKLLQEQDLKRRGDLVDHDQLVLIESQDRELSKILQEQERAKAKKARERARQKAILKKQQQKKASLEGAVGGVSEINPSNAASSPVSSLNASAEDLYQNAECENSLSDASEYRRYHHTPSPEHHRYTNIACAIDPTYQRRVQRGELPIPQSPEQGQPIEPPVKTSSPISSFIEPDECPVPPYMPIQGQRRTASLEKSKKKSSRLGTKDESNKSNCKQQ